MMLHWMQFQISSITIILIGIALVFLVKKIINVLLENLRLPPGPWGAPIVGYLPFIGSEPMSSRLGLLAKQHAAKGVMSVRLGGELVVCLSDARVVRDVFKRMEFTGRPSTPLNNLVGRIGVITSDGELWRRQRQFLLEKLRALGVTHSGEGKQFMEDLIMREVEELMETLYRREREPLDPDRLLGRHVHNVILQLICSQRFLEGDARFHAYYAQIGESMRLYGQLHIGEYLPVYLNLPGKSEVFNKLIDGHKSICKYQLEIIKDRIEHATTEEPRDLLEHYLLEISKARETGEHSAVFAGVDEEEQVVQVMNDLFSAGMETVKSTLLWTLALMARPECAQARARARAELADAAGAGRRVTLAHAHQLTYCQATLLEVLRFCNVVPMGTVHSANRDCVVEGYKIPRGSQVIALISTLHMDPSVWTDPHLFNPERFINEKGQLTRNDNFMPFGVGRRMCLGDILARTELFLFFFNILNRFDFELPQGDPLPALEGIVGVTHAPHSYRLEFQRRDSVMETNNKLRHVASY